MAPWNTMVPVGRKAVSASIFKGPPQRKNYFVLRLTLIRYKLPL